MWCVVKLYFKSSYHNSATKIKRKTKFEWGNELLERGHVKGLANKS